jgi:hypothetical protein
MTLPRTPFLDPERHDSGMATKFAALGIANGV